MLFSSRSPFQASTDLPLPSDDMVIKVQSAAGIAEVSGLTFRLD